MFDAWTILERGLPFVPQSLSLLYVRTSNRENMDRQSWWYLAPRVVVIYLAPLLFSLFFFSRHWHDGVDVDEREHLALVAEAGRHLPGRRALAAQGRVGGGLQGKGVGRGKKRLVTRVKEIHGSMEHLGGLLHIRFRFHQQFSVLPLLLDCGQPAPPPWGSWGAHLERQWREMREGGEEPKSREERLT